MLPYPIFFEIYDFNYFEKAAFILEPSGRDDAIADNLMHDSTRIAEHILRKLGYKIFNINTRVQIPRVYAEQAVIFYAGHGLEGGAELIYTTNDVLRISEVITPIRTPKLIILNSACFGGTWFNYAAQGRLIVSASNDTAGLILGEYTNETQTEVLVYPPSLIDLLFYCLCL